MTAEENSGISRNTTAKISCEKMEVSINVTQEGTVGISERVDNKLQIYPNPVQNEIFIKSDFQIERVEIYSITGALLKFDSNFKEKIPVSALPQGIYLLKVYTDKGLKVSKFVKQ